MAQVIKQIPEQIDIQMVAGDDLEILVNIGIPLTGYTLDAHINTEPVTAFTITPLDLSTGQFYLTLDKTITAVLPTGTTWAFEWDDVNGNHLTIIEGKFRMKGDV